MKDHTIATINSKNVKGVVHLLFVPLGRSATDIVHAWRNNTSQIFITNIKTNKGKGLAKQYKDTSYAQYIYCDLVAHMKTSSATNINTRKLLRYITNVGINDNSWRGITSASLPHWAKQIRI